MSTKLSALNPAVLADLSPDTLIYVVPTPGVMFKCTLAVLTAYLNISAGGGIVETIVPDFAILVNSSDPANPIIAVNTVDLDALYDAAGDAAAAAAFAIQRANHTGSQAISTVTGLQTALDDKAPVISPSLTGNPTAPTPSAADNDTSIATTAFVQGEGFYKVADWSLLGNLGATETVTGIDKTLVRAFGTLDQACTITVTTSANQRIELLLAQDGTGGRAVTWTISGVVWLTQLGTAPDLSTAPAGAIHRVVITNVNGVPYGEWTTEPPVEAFTYAISDEVTALTTGTAKITFRAPFACSLVGARASLSTVSSSGIPTFDVNEGGTTLMSTKLTIDASEKTSVTAATPVVISDNLIADDAEITIDVDVAGTGATGAKVTLYLRRR